MSREPVRDVYRHDLPTTPLVAEDLQSLRFGVALRGYSMAQVDDVLDRLAHEIAERDALIAQLQGYHDARPPEPAAAGDGSADGSTGNGSTANGLPYPAPSGQPVAHAEVAAEPHADDA